MAGRTTIWTIMAAVGGLLAGVAAVLGLFMAKPETISVFVPVQVLRDAVAASGDQVAVDNAGVAASGDEPALSVPIPGNSGLSTDVASPTVQAPLQTQALRSGLTVSLVSLVDTEDRYVATIRFENSGPNPVGVAVRSDGATRGEMVLTDGRGGSCQFAANGEGWGTLDTESEDPAFVDNRDFRTVQSQGRAQHTMFFNKRRCDTRISGRDGLAISGSFVVLENDERHATPVYFENIRIQTAQ
jgi:hypothetical protein